MHARATYINARKDHADLTGRASAKVGQEEFNRLLARRKYQDWPTRYATDTDDYYRDKCATHTAIVAEELAREILDG